MYFVYKKTTKMYLHSILFTNNISVCFWTLTSTYILTLPKLTFTYSSLIGSIANFTSIFAQNNSKRKFYFQNISFTWSNRYIKIYWGIIKEKFSRFIKSILQQNIVHVLISSEVILMTFKCLCSWKNATKISSPEKSACICIILFQSL